MGTVSAASMRGCLAGIISRSDVIGLVMIWKEQSVFLVIYNGIYILFLQLSVSN